MQITHRQKPKSDYDNFKHRSGKIQFTPLLSGEAGACDNFEFAIVSTPGDYHTPRHRHNFDQVRVLLEGEFGYAKGKVQKAGTIGYFCEGTYYTQNCEGPSETLLLQGSGASQNNYMGLSMLKAATEELAEKAGGHFTNGIYGREDASGNIRSQDGYEAAWEYKFQRKLEYPKPRFDGPIIMNAENFDWQKSEFQQGVELRHLGTFQERYTSIVQWRIQAGASFEVSVSPVRRLFFVYSGEGRINGEVVRRHSAANINPEEAVVVEAVNELTMLSIGLPATNRSTS